MIADGLTKTGNQRVLRNMLTTLKTEQMETSREQLSSNLIDCKNKLINAEDSDAAVRDGNPSTGHKKILMHSREDEKILMHSRADEKVPTPAVRGVNPSAGHKKIVMDCRENKEHREGLPRKLAQEHRDGLPRKLAQEDREGLPRKLAQEDRDGLPRKLALEDREGLAEKNGTRRS